MNRSSTIQQLQQQIEQLTDELTKARKRLEIQQQRITKQRRQQRTLRQQLVHKYGQEFLAMIDGDPRAKVEITELVEKIVFKDEQGHVISETEEFAVGKVYELRFVNSPLQPNGWDED